MTVKLRAPIPDDLKSMTITLSKNLGVYGVWSMVYGPWSMVHGPWCMVRGVWCDIWCIKEATRPMKLVQSVSRHPSITHVQVWYIGMVYGAWCMVCGVWCMV